MRPRTTTYLPHLPLLNWCWLAGLMALAGFVAWDSGLLNWMLSTDRTYLCPLIILAFLAACLHCAWLSYRLGCEMQAAQQILSGQTAHEQRHVSHYFRQLALTPTPERQQVLAEWLGEQLRGQHQVGWFVNGTLIKLGLLGTVIGFVIMLGSLGKLESLDTTQVQLLMKQMTGGMGIALNTTLLGLTGSILLGIQYLYLDRAADGLLAELIQQDHASSHKADRTQSGLI